MNKSKNLVIELYRFLFTCIIYIYHFRTYSEIQKMKGNFSGGYLGVEFFFLISGFYLMKSITKKRNQEKKGFINDGIAFLKKRIQRLYPEYIVSICLLIIVSFIGSRGDFTVFYLIKDGFPDLICVQAFFVNKKINSLLWFVSVLIWGSLLIKIVLSLISVRNYLIVANFFSFVFFIYAFLEIGFLDLTQNKYFYLDGFLRGFSELIIGCTIYCIVQYLNDRKICASLIVVNIISISCFSFSAFLMFFRGDDRIDFVILFLLMIIVFIEGNREIKIDDKSIRNKVIGVLGSVSYGMYLNQVLIQKVVHSVFPGYRFRIVIFISLILLLIVSAVLHFGISKGINLIKTKNRYSYWGDNEC